MAEFIQFIEFKTTKPEAVEALMQNYEFSDESTASNSVLVQDRDLPDWYVAIVRFPSYEAAQVNNELPETQEFARRMNELVDEGPNFCNLNVIAEWNR